MKSTLPLLAALGLAAAHTTPKSNLEITNPSNIATRSLDKRGRLGGVYYCVDDYFRGRCEYNVLKLGSCYNVKQNGPFWNAITSIGPDQGTYCNVFDAVGCYGIAHGFTWPGTNHIGRTYGNSNDAVKSMRCVKLYSGMKTY